MKCVPLPIGEGANSNLAASPYYYLTIKNIRKYSAPGGHGVLIVFYFFSVFSAPSPRPLRLNFYSFLSDFRTFPPSELSQKIFFNPLLPFPHKILIFANSFQKWKRIKKICHVKNLRSNRKRIFGGQQRF